LSDTPALDEPAIVVIRFGFSPRLQDAPYGHRVPLTTADTPGAVSGPS
jgi:hypothetical protein